MDMDLPDMRLFFKVSYKGGGGSAVLDFLFRKVNARKGNKVFLPPVPAGQLRKRCVGKQVNGTFKKVYLAACAVC